LGHNKSSELTQTRGELSENDTGKTKRVCIRKQLKPKALYTEIERSPNIETLE